MNIGVILAAGTGTRVGADIPKQFIEVMGKPILAYTLEIFQNNQNIDAIEIVCHENWIDEIEQLVNKYKIRKTKWLTIGGSTFQESTMNGIFNLKGKISSEDIVVISFGVSPMTTDEVIDDSILVCEKYGNAISSEDMVMCTCIKENENSSIEPISRESIKGFANPWTFKFGEICEAYEIAKEKGILNDLEPHTTSLYFALGKRIYFSKGNHSICKITYKEDLDIFESYLLLKQKKEQEADKIIKESN